jgi:hypothetical protein
MPTRTGQPTAEEIVAAQRAAQGPPPPPNEDHGVAIAVATAAALAATKAAFSAAADPATDTTLIVPATAGATLGAAAAGILQSFDSMFAQRRAADTQKFVDVLHREAPDIAEQARIALAAREAQREKTFAAKSRVRLQADVQAALALPDARERRAAIDAILVRERRYVALREQAIEGRAVGSAHAAEIRQASPAGAYWKLNPRLDHCPDCLRMGDRVWTWTVLDELFPPLHLHCGCTLYTLATAIKMGWVAPDTLPSGDNLILECTAREIVWTADGIQADVALLEAVREKYQPAPEPPAMPDLDALTDDEVLDLLVSETATALVESPRDVSRQLRDRIGRWRHMLQHVAQGQARRSRQEPEPTIDPVRTSGPQVFADLVHATTWADQEFSLWKGNLDPRERHALAVYKDDNKERYRQINRALRGRQDWTREARVLAPLISAGLARHQLSQPITVHRAIPLSDLAGWPPQVGEDLPEPAFMSTSMVESVPRDRYVDRRGGSVMLAIVLPKGTPAGYMDAFPGESGDGEILLPAGAVIRVQSVDEHEGNFALTATLVGFQAGPPELRGAAA